MREIFQVHINTVSNSNTKKGRKTALRRFDEWLDSDTELEKVNKYDLRDWVESMKGSVSDLSLKNYYYGVSKFFSWAEDWGEEFDVNIDEEQNPFNHVKLTDFDVDPNSPTLQQQAQKSEQSYRALSIEQVQKLLQNVPAPVERNELLLRLLYQTGVRKSELVSIELKDIDREHREIQIDSAKTNEYRTVFYRESLDTLFDIYIDRGYRGRFPYSDTSQYLFLTRQSEQISKNRVGEIVRKAAEDAGIQGEVFRYSPGGNEETSYSKVTPHVLRHTFAHHAIHEGERLDIATLSEVMGHASIETTKKYLRASKEQKRKTMKKTGPGFTSNDLEPE